MHNESRNTIQDLIDAQRAEIARLIRENAELKRQQMLSVKRSASLAAVQEAHHLPANTTGKYLEHTVSVLSSFLFLFHPLFTQSPQNGKREKHVTLGLSVQNSKSKILSRSKIDVKL